MSYALSRPTTARRGGLLGIVIGAHIGVILIVMAAKTVAPQIMEMPLIVDLIQPALSRALDFGVFHGINPTGGTAVAAMTQKLSSTTNSVEIAAAKPYTYIDAADAL